MAKFILGYEQPLDDHLTQFTSKADADYGSEEWVEVEADSLEEAKEKYEETFLAWQERTK